MAAEESTDDDSDDVGREVRLGRDDTLSEEAEREGRDGRLRELAAEDSPSAGGVSDDEALSEDVASVGVGAGCDERVECELRPGPVVTAVLDDDACCKVVGDVSIWVTRSTGALMRAVIPAMMAEKNVFTTLQ